MKRAWGDARFLGRQRAFGIGKAVPSSSFLHKGVAVVWQL